MSLEFDFYDAVCGVEKLQRNDWLMQCMLLLRDTAVIATFCWVKCAQRCHCNWTQFAVCTRSRCDVENPFRLQRFRGGTHRFCFVTPLLTATFCWVKCAQRCHCNWTQFAVCTHGRCDAETRSDCSVSEAEHIASAS